MARAAKSILKGILTMLFIVVAAAVFAGIGFILLVTALYYTWMLFLNYGILAGGLAIVALAAILIIAVWLLIKQIRKGTADGGND